MHDRYENPVRSKSYRRLQFWYILVVYTLYAVYIVPCITILVVHMHVHVLSLPRQWNYGISMGGAACTVLEFHCICKLCILRTIESVYQCNMYCSLTLIKAEIHRAVGALYP